MPNILTVVEGVRGCGYRKPGGIYARLDGKGEPCGLLPIPLTVCPTCSCGVKPTRGFTWVNLAALAANQTCAKLGGCGNCPMADAGITKSGLVWIGEAFYKTPQDWLKEASLMGISRRLKTLPHGFEIGKTWIAAAHRKAIANTPRFGEPTVYTPGIFHVFQPSRIEYVVTGDEPIEQLESLERRGFTLVKIIRDIDQPELQVAHSSTKINTGVTV